MRKKKENISSFQYYDLYYADSRLNIGYIGSIRYFSFILGNISLKSEGSFRDIFFPSHAYSR